MDLTLTHGKNKCSSTQFQCGNGHCIFARYVCDNHHDCSDLSDENPTLCGDDPCRNRFYCQKSRRCLPYTYCCHHPDSTSETHSDIRPPDCTDDKLFVCCFGLNHVPLQNDTRRIGFPYKDQSSDSISNTTSPRFDSTAASILIGVCSGLMLILAIILAIFVVVRRLTKKRSRRPPTPYFGRTHMEEHSGRYEMPPSNGRRRSQIRVVYVNDSNMDMIIDEQSVCSVVFEDQEEQEKHIFDAPPPSYAQLEQPPSYASLIGVQHK